MTTPVSIPVIFFSLQGSGSHVSWRPLCPLKYCTVGTWGRRDQRRHRSYRWYRHTPPPRAHSIRAHTPGGQPAPVTAEQTHTPRLRHTAWRPRQRHGARLRQSHRHVKAALTAPPSPPEPTRVELTRSGAEASEPEAHTHRGWVGGHSRGDGAGSPPPFTHSRASASQRQGPGPCPSPTPTRTLVCRQGRAPSHTHTHTRTRSHSLRSGSRSHRPTLRFGALGLFPHRHRPPPSTSGFLPGC